MAHQSSNQRFPCIWLVLWLIFAWTSAAAADMIKTEHTRARLLSEPARIRPGQSFWLALQLSPETGWHTYWKNPGDAGKPTAIKWNLPPGFTAGSLQWPYPQRIRSGPLVSFGYTGAVNLLTEIKAGRLPPDLDEVEISAAADWLVCEAICIPESAVLTLSLPVGPEGAADPENAAVFKAARERLPRTAAWAASYIYKDNQLVFDAPLGLTAHRKYGGVYPRNADFAGNKNRLTAMEGNAAQIYAPAKSAFQPSMAVVLQGTENRPANELESLLFFPVEDNLIENSSNQSFLLGENAVRVTVNAGYMEQTGPFHGVLVLKHAGNPGVTAVEFTAQPVNELPDLEFNAKPGNR